jgi:iron complex outermembrane recepter protein
VQDIPVEDIERIEVVLGPGGPAWGSNSLNGVINVVTKPAAETQGNLVSVLAGDDLGPELLVRHGDTFEDGHWRAWARLSGNDAMHPTDTTGGHDDRDLVRSGFRVDWDNNPDQVLTIDGDVYEGNSHQLLAIPSIDPPFSIKTQDNQQVSGEHLLLNWTTKDGPSEETSLLAYVDSTQRTGELTDEKRNTFDLEWQRRRQLSADHDVVFGAGVRAISSSFQNGSVASFNPDDRQLLQESLFAEDEITLVPDTLSLTLGARLEHHTYTDTELQPSAKLTWTPTANQTVWAAVSHALRTPSQVDHDGTALVAVIPDSPPGFDSELVLQGNGNVEPVELLAFELGWRARVSQRFTLDVATFYNSFTNNVLYTQGTVSAVDANTLLVPLIPGNDGHDLARGFEVSTEFQAREDWTLSAGWAFLDIHSGSDGAVSAFPDSAGGSAPQNQLIVQSKHDLSKDVDFDVLLIHVDQLSALNVPAYWRADLRLGWRADPTTEWSLGLRNLFHDHELEFSGAQYGGESEAETSLWLGYVKRF